MKDKSIVNGIEVIERDKKIEESTGHTTEDCRQKSLENKRAMGNYKMEGRALFMDNWKNYWNTYGGIIKVSFGILILVAAVCVIAFYVYPTYLQDHPVESIDVEIPSEMNAGMEFSYPVTILPSNASDKSLIVKSGDVSVIPKIEHGRLYIAIDDFVPDGKKITISLQSKKYVDSYKEVSFIAKNDLDMKLNATSTSMSMGDTIKLNATFNRQIDAPIVWSCDNNNIRLNQKGSTIEIYAPYDGWEQKVTDITITGKVPNTLYSSSITVKVSADFQMSFKNAPTDYLNLGDSYTFELNLPKGYDSSDVQWSVSGDNVSLIKNTGSSSILVIGTDAIPGSTIKVDVHSKSFGAISKTCTIDEVIHLKTSDQVKSIMKHPNAKFKLMNDINIGTILPIGDTGSGTYSSFYGELNGNGHEITYVYSSRAHIDNDVGYVGLFAQLKDAKVYNLKINATISLGNSSDRYKVVNAGGLAGSASGSEVSNIECKLTMRSPGKDADYWVGGLVGRCDNTKVTINSCILSVDINVVGGSVHAGGIFGHNLNTTVSINDAVVKGSIYSKGGLAGGWGSSGGIGGYASDGTTTTITKCNAGGCSTKSADGGFGGNNKTSSVVARVGGSATVTIN